MEKSIARIISEFAVNLKFEDLPHEVVETAKRFMYDSLACAYGGYLTKDVKIIRDLYKDMAGKEEATVLALAKKFQQ